MLLNKGILFLKHIEKKQQHRTDFKNPYIQCPPKVLEQNKILTISKNVLILNALYKQYGSKIRPNETLGLILDPYCLIPSVSFLLKTGCIAWYYLNCVAI